MSDLRRTDDARGEIRFPPRGRGPRISAPVDGVIVDVVANAGQFMSLAVPAPLLHMVEDKR